MTGADVTASAIGLIVFFWIYGAIIVGMCRWNTAIFFKSTIILQNTD